MHSQPTSAICTYLKPFKHGIKIALLFGAAFAFTHLAAAPVAGWVPKAQMSIVSTNVNPDKAALLLDGLTIAGSANAWNGGALSAPMQVVIDLASPYSLTQFKMWRGNGAGTGLVNAEYSLNQTTWAAWGSLSGGNWSQSVLSSVLPAKVGRYIRLTIPTLSDTVDWHEVDVYGTATDVTAPSTPTGLKSTSKTMGSVSLAWLASTDNVGVTGYEIFRGTTSIGTTTSSTLTFTDSGLLSSTAYSYSVRARDAVGNWSAKTSALSVTTAAENIPPSTPALSVVTKSGSSVSLGWTAASDNIAVTAYEILNGTTVVATTNASTLVYTKTGLLPATAYTLGVRARDAIGNRSAISSLSVTTSAEAKAPSIPTGLKSLSKTNHSVTLSWLASSDNVAVEAYEIFRGTTSVGTTNSSTLTFTDEGVLPSTAYAYSVRAKDSSGNFSAKTTAVSVTTLPESIAPATPTGLSVASVTSTSVKLTWLATTDNVAVTAYEVFKGDLSLGTTTASVLTFNNTGLLPSTAYTYSVRARDAAGNWSAKSNAVIGTTAPEAVAPSTPTGLKSTSKTMGSVSLAWLASTDNVGVTAYEIFRGTTSIGTTTSSTLTFTDSGLLSSTAYSYSVRARDAVGNWSAKTSALSVTTAAENIPPSTPTLSVVTKSGSSVSLGWTAASDNIAVTAYEILNGTTVVATTNASTLVYTKTGLLPATAYTLGVRARDAIGNRSAISSLSVTTSAEAKAPSIPTGLKSLSKTNHSVTLSWLASSDNVAVEAYEIFRGTTSVGTTNSSTLTFTDEGVLPSTAYAYSVRAKDSSGNFSAKTTAVSVITLPESIAPATPTGLSVASVTSTSVKLTWLATTDNVAVTAYEVFKGDLSLGTTTASVLTFNNTGLLPSTAYTYSVRARDAAGNWSAKSNAVIGTTAPEAVAPSTPTGLKSTSKTMGSVSLAWLAATDNVGVTGYEIFRGTTSIGTTTSSTLTFTDSGLLSSTAYTYSVRARDAVGNWSAKTSALSVTTLADTTAPTVPTEFRVLSKTQTTVSLTWVASTDDIGVTAYEIFKGTTSLGSTSANVLVFTQGGLSANTSHTFTVRARDAAGNWSAKTSALNVTTPTAESVDLVLAPLAFTEQPFGSVTLVDTIDTATTAPAAQSASAVSTVQTILGQSARTLPPGPDARFFTYRLGKNKGLVAKQAYILDIEYPDDVPRAMFIANRGADFLRGFATGTAVGDARKAWTLSTLESLNYPQSNTWKHHQTLFYLHERFSPTAERNSVCAVRDLLPADGFDVSIFQTMQLNDPRANGAAVGKIRLYKVNTPNTLPATINYPGTLPRRHLFWREEMADEAVSNGSATKRSVTDAIDWFGFKMDMGSALGFNTVGKDLMEWGFNQGFDSGNSDWALNAQPPLTNIWREIVLKAKSKNLYLMPYLEYGGTVGYNCLPGGTRTCNKTPGTYNSLGLQRRTQKLFAGTYGPGGNLDDYTGVYWTEDKSADLTDPDTETDLKKVLDKIIVQYKDQAEFAGLWLRMRQSKLPISFAPETIARYNADHPEALRTLSQLQTDEASRTSYYDWWHGKRRDFLRKMRDYIRTGTADNRLQVLFTAYPGEPTPKGFDTNQSTSAFNLVTDDPTWWANYRSTLNDTTDPMKWYRYKWNSRTVSEVINARAHKVGLEKTFPIQGNNFNNDRQETTHSTPPADPARYNAEDGIAMTYEFGNALYTVADSALLDEYNNASGGQSLTHHFPLNEDNGQAHSESYNVANCTNDKRYTLTDSEPFQGKVGYMSVAVERAGPYSVLSEARALANGNPVNISYLESSSMSRGFPAYVRRFNQALLSLPALPASKMPSMSSDSEVVVKQINTVGQGTYYAVINTAMTSKIATIIDFGGSAQSIVDLLSGTTHIAKRLQFDLYPGEVRTFKIP